MAKTLTIPWADGNGDIILTYDGQGDGTVTVRSTTDNLGSDRSQTITLRTADGSKAVQVIIVQKTGYQLFITSDNYVFIDVNEKPFLVMPGK